VLREQPHEAVHGLAVFECQDRRDAFDPEVLCQPRGLVHIDLGQDERALAVDRGLLQLRAELPTRAAPLGPEIYYHRHLSGAVEHLALEVGVTDIDYPLRRRGLWHCNLRLQFTTFRKGCPSRAFRTACAPLSRMSSSPSSA